MSSTITCLWIQEELDDISIVCINSWLKLGYNINLYTYSFAFRNEWINTKYDNNVIILDANTVIPYKINESDNYPFVSDLFRFTLFNINKKSNDKKRIIWLDTDQFLLRKVPEFNFVSSQHTLKKGAFAHKKATKIPAIFGLAFNGEEKVDWDYIIDKGNKKATTYQSGYLKWFEKELLKEDVLLEPEVFAPIHWGWAKQIYTCHVLPIVMKYGLEPPVFLELYKNKSIVGIHLWRAMLNKNKWDIKGDSIFNQLRMRTLY